MNDSISLFRETYGIDSDVESLVRKELAMIQIDGLLDDISGNKSFDQFYNRCDVLRKAGGKHSWTRASVMSVARAAVGGGFSFVRHPIFGRSLTEKDSEKVDQILEPVYNLFYGIVDNDDYIQNLATLSDKLLYTIVSFVLYGQAAWEIVRDDNGKAIDFDVLPGITFPNVTKKGRFKSPAYLFRAWNSQNVVKYSNPRDIVFFRWPGIDYSSFGSTEYEALSDVVIPADLYAGYAYKMHFENLEAPYNGVWEISPDTEDEDYKRFLSMLYHRYRGVKNFGKNPLAIRGQINFKETSSLSEEDAPYLEGRQYNQIEISAVTGVSSAKMGLAENATRTNYRELRRDFHENTLRPIFAIIEDVIYRQIFVREFKVKEHKLVFNRPDLTTALEEATIVTRYVQNGILNPNEARQIIGRPPREDEFGNVFLQPSNLLESGTSGDTAQDDPNTNPEGGSARQFDQQRPPDQTRSEQEPLDNTKPPQNKSLDRDNIINELKQWKTFQLRIVKGERLNREFVCEYVPQDVQHAIKNILTNHNDGEFVKELFNTLINEI